MDKINYAKIEEHIRGILEALGDDPDREGLRETPARVAKMYGEVFEGMNYTNAEIEIGFIQFKNLLQQLHKAVQSLIRHFRFLLFLRLNLKSAPASASARE